jgi:prepilin-type N-terminal cleavage/methylation domain-containing protein
MLTYFKYTIFSLFSRRGRNAGFTLVELLVVISIATIILTALIIQQSTWNDTLSLRTQNYELSLILRQAQVHSLGVREDTSGSGDKFGIGYGVYFDHNQRDRYLYFADRNGDGNYDPSELVETYFLKRGVTLDKFCAVLGNNDSSPSFRLTEIVDLSRKKLLVHHIVAPRELREELKLQIHFFFRFPIWPCDSRYELAITNIYLNYLEIITLYIKELI